MKKSDKILRYVFVVVITALIVLQGASLCGCDNGQHNSGENGFFEIKIFVRDTDFQHLEDVEITYNGETVDYDEQNYAIRITTGYKDFDINALGVKGYNCLAVNIKDIYTERFFEVDENVITLIIWDENVKYTEEDFVNIGSKVVDNESYLSETRITGFDVYVNGKYVATPKGGDFNLNYVLVGTELSVVDDRYEWVDAANNPAGPVIVTKYDDNDCITFRGVLKDDE